MKVQKYFLEVNHDLHCHVYLCATKITPRSLDFGLGHFVLREVFDLISIQSSIQCYYRIGKSLHVFRD